jgi:hypothetical protein
MAKNKVEIDVKVDDKGTTKKLGLESKKAAKGLDNTAKGARTADRNLKGTAQASSNATKNFSKMAQGTGGLVAAYATLAANIFAISAAFQFLKNAGDLRALEASQAQYTARTGLNMKLLTSRIQEASGGIISFQEASQAAAIGRAAGLSPDQLERLGSAAKNAAAALGRDTTDAFQRLTRGAIKAEPELLDELGIIIRLERVTKDYKKALDITGRELTTFEKTQAVVNATLKQSEEKFKDVGDSVNQVARLGKAFDDLVKSIQRSIVGPAEFIANVFTKNVAALASAFALLGVSITKALAPTVNMENLSELTEGAKKRISSIADPSSAAGAKAAKGDFSSMKTLEKAARSKTSTVLNLSRMERAQIKKDLKLIQADHARTMAANATGFKKYTLGVIANLKVMQAEHGVVMGTMKAGLGGLAKFASRAMNAIAIIGMITLAVSLGKELLNLLKSPELKKMEDTASRLKSRFEEQNTAVADTLLTLEAADSVMGRLVQQTNMFNQLSAKGSGALLDKIGRVNVDTAFTTTMQTGTDKTKKVAVTTRNRHDDSLAMAEASKTTMLAEGGPLAAFITSMEMASDRAQAAGRNTDAFDAKLGQLKTTLQAAAGANIDTRDEAIAYNQALTDSVGLIDEVRNGHDNLSISLNAEANAFQGITQAAEQFSELQTQLKGSESQTTKLVNIFNSFKGSLEGMTQIPKDGILAEFLDTAALANLQTALGLSDKAMQSLTKSAAAAQLQTTGTSLLADANTLAKGSAPADQALAEGMLNRLPFMQKEAQHKRQLAELDRQLLALAHEKNLAAAGQTTLSAEQLAANTANTEKLLAQRALLEENFRYIAQIQAGLAENLESGLGSALEKIITGTMKAKDAFKAMAQSIIQSMAKIVAQKMAEQILGAVGFDTLFARQGGVFSQGRKVPGYSMGGVARGPQAGYPVTLHGTEAVVPLPDGKTIPVEMKSGGSQQNIVNVTVASDGSVQSRQESGEGDMEHLGKAVAAAVQKELHNQKRSGGILSPVGAT